MLFLSALQALLANIAAMYAVYHGPEGLKTIAERVNGLAAVLAEGERAPSPLLGRRGVSGLGGDPAPVVLCRHLSAHCLLPNPPHFLHHPSSPNHPPPPAGARKLGLGVGEAPFFDTVRISVGDAPSVLAAAAAQGVNLRQLDASTVTVSFDETTTLADVDQLLAILNGGKAPAFTAEALAPGVAGGVGAFERTSPFLQHPTFNSYHTGEVLAGCFPASWGERWGWLPAGRPLEGGAVRSLRGPLVAGRYTSCTSATASRRPPAPTHLTYPALQSTSCCAT